MKKNRVRQWFQDHKRELIITGLMVSGVGIAVGAVLVANCMNGENNSAEEISYLFNKATSVPEDDSILSDGHRYENFSNDSTIYDFDKIKNRTSCTKASHEVNGFVRNLHEGWKASPEKIAEAAERGIVLGENQTIVNSYITGKNNSLA